MEDVDIEEQLESRSYQTQLEEIATSKNTIIHLPTGSGKTFIAIRLINRCRHSLKLPWGSGGKRTFFLVNTIPLVNQQKRVIRSLCAVKSVAVAGYSGEDGIDYWDKKKWDAELSEHQVIVMTSQILADMLTHSYIRIEDINLLIFDECHHAVVDHPMRLVMKHFEGCPIEKQPRVLGLTATLLNSNVNINKVEESLRELETTFHATIATVNELGEVLSYSTNPHEYLKLYRSTPLTSAAEEAIKILENLQSLIINMTLPRMTGDPNIKLETGQRDISTDPKKVSKNIKLETEQRDISTDPEETEQRDINTDPKETEQRDISIDPEEVCKNIKLKTEQRDISTEPEETDQRDISTDPEGTEQRDIDTDPKETEQQDIIIDPEVCKNVKLNIEQRDISTEPEETDQRDISTDPEETEQRDIDTDPKETEQQDIIIDPEVCKNIKLNIEQRDISTEPEETDQRDISTDPERTEQRDNDTDPKETEQQDIIIDPEVCKNIKLNIEQRDIITEPEETDQRDISTDPEGTEQRDIDTDPKETEQQDIIIDPEVCKNVKLNIEQRDISTEPEETDQRDISTDPEETEQRDIDTDPKETEQQDIIIDPEVCKNIKLNIEQRDISTEPEETDQRDISTDPEGTDQQDINTDPKETEQRDISIDPEEVCKNIKLKTEQRDISTELEETDQRDINTDPKGTEQRDISIDPEEVCKNIKLNTEQRDISTELEETDQRDINTDPKETELRDISIDPEKVSKNIKLKTEQRDISTEPEETDQRDISTDPEETEQRDISIDPEKVRKNIKLKTEQRDISTELKETEQRNISTDPEESKQRDISTDLEESKQRDISTDLEEIVKEVRKMMASLIAFIEELGVYGGSLSCIAYVILLERLKRKAITLAEEHLYKITITNCTMARMILLNSMKGDEGYERIIKHSSEKVIELLNVLKEFNPEHYNDPSASKSLMVNLAKQPLSGIIFTKQRFTAKIVYNLLKDVKDANPKEFGFLNHDFLVGFNINPFKRTREQFYTKKASQTALLKFSNKELNCLISTSVIEEGVDIPQCLLVLRYDPPSEYRSYIQSKGRARCSDSTFVVMVNEKNKDKFMHQYEGFQTTENYIQRMLVGNTEDRDAPTQEDIEDSLYNEDEIPPYITTRGARLSSVQAISLLNRYCSVLPHDQFTTISPMWVEEKICDPKKGIMRQVKIYMPIACPIKDIISGEPKGQLKAAKRSAALNACITLHKAGELDSLTLLPRSYGTVDFEQPDVKSCFPNWPVNENKDVGEDVPKPGTKKRVRKHDRVFPTYLKGPKRIHESHKFYLHIITLKTLFAEPKDSREKAMFRLLHEGNGYGFLTTQALPKLCDFPIFLAEGEVKTTMHMNYAVIDLNSKTFDLVKRFHFFLFDQVLAIKKKFTAFDGTQYGMYVVPVNTSDNNGKKDYDIDWHVMQTHTEIRPVVEPPYEERKSLKVVAENYKYHVVSPWYRGFLLPSRYIVSNVMEYMTPQSQFAPNSETTYADYYSSKYNLEIMGDKNQPLLEVRRLSSRFNCLMPAAATINSFTEKQLKMIALAQGDDKPKGFPEIFVPEFCILYDFPSVLWYKAIMLPSIVHRVFMLLVAYELRAEIAKQTKIGLVHLLPGQEWMPIVVNMQVAVKSLLSLVEDHLPMSNNIDRINNPIDEDAPRPLNIITMKESLYQLQRKKISQEYNWDEKIEPLDIERNISSVTVMDVECYDEFVSAPMSVAPDSESPFRSPPRKLAAILPSPVQKIVQIKILEKKLTARGPELRDVLAAITTINSHDTFDLERAETLGDSFLKFVAGLYLHHKFPLLNEGQLTNIKGRFIGNRNLYYAGANVLLGGRMKVEQFAPWTDFLTPGFFAPVKVQKLIQEKQIRPTCLIGVQLSQEEVLSGRISEESWELIRQKLSAENESALEQEPVGGAQVAMQCHVRAQAVSDKSVADCVESLVGTYLLSEGILGGVKILEWLKVLPPQHNFAELLTKKIPTVLTENKSTEDDVNRIMNYCREDIETILDYKFQDPAFLLEALSHPSYIRNRLTRSYERLEFLGDAILDFLITSHLFESCPEMKPGDLTDLRSALVNNVTFASYVVRLGLHKYLCYQLNPFLETAIMTFIEHQEKRDHNIVEDVLYLIDEEDCTIAEYVEVPKVLSDIFESLAGAIYLDSGGDLKTVWAVFYRIMCNEIHSFSRQIPRQPVRILYEKIHACPQYGKPQFPDKNLQKVMVPVTVTKNGKQYTVHGFGGSKFQAKRAAAKLALKVLGI